MALLLITGITVAGGCGGSGDDHTVAERDPTTATAATTTTRPEPTTTTTAPAPTTTTTMPAYSFDGSVPPPELVTTGDDYVAILASYDRYLDWLTGHNPDPALLTNVFVDGTDVKKRWESDLRILSEKDLRMFDVNRTYEGRVDTADALLVSVIVSEEPTEVRLVDQAGDVVDSAMLENGNRTTVLLVNVAGRWRINSIVPLLDADTTVQL